MRHGPIEREVEMAGIVATAEIDVAASPERVWSALTDPDEIQQYMFGTRVETDWQPGHSIRWKGEWEGKPYEDKGTVVSCEPERSLVVTHFSPLTGQDDVPENYHTLTYSLAANEGGTHVSLSQDNNGSDEEAQHSQENWAMMLGGLKKHVENGG
jgi:uncharacterized protein YndB with AHSA1/START domain